MKASAIVGLPARAHGTLGLLPGKLRHRLDVLCMSARRGADSSATNHPSADAMQNTGQPKQAECQVEVERRAVTSTCGGTIRCGIFLLRRNAERGQILAEQTGDRQCRHA